MSVSTQASTRQQELEELEVILRCVRVILESAVNEKTIAAAIELAKVCITRVERSHRRLEDDGSPPPAQRSGPEDAPAPGFGLAA